jgi:hypothetical protein
MCMYVVSLHMAREESMVQPVLTWSKRRIKAKQHNTAPHNNKRDSYAGPCCRGSGDRDRSLGVVGERMAWRHVFRRFSRPCALVNRESGKVVSTYRKPPQQLLHQRESVVLSRRHRHSPRVGPHLNVSTHWQRGGQTSSFCGVRGSKGSMRTSGMDSA